MNPQEEKMLERIGNVSETGPELPSGKFGWTEYKLNLGKLAKVLVELEEKIDKKIEMGPRMKMASPMTASGCSTPNYSTGTLQDPYLTALDDVENSFEKGTMSILVKVLDNLRKNHKGE